MNELLTIFFLSTFVLYNESPKGYYSWSTKQALGPTQTTIDLIIFYTSMLVGESILRGSFWCISEKRINATVLCSTAIDSVADGETTDGNSSPNATVTS